MPSSCHASQNNEHVVNQRPERREKKQPVLGEQHRRDHTADIEEDLRREQDSCQMDAQLDLIGREIPFRRYYRDLRTSAQTAARKSPSAACPTDRSLRSSTVMMMENVFWASASRFSARKRV